jgi:DNA-directed RNA polymerase subunit RPC12/RpoP
VADDPPHAAVYEVTCPHCGKAFREELLSGSAARYNGFKCPHCRLFVPLERVAGDGDSPAAGTSSPNWRP